ncbi:MAG: long-chain fatty acid--CoA ligase [Myxococcales bacterium]|nr:long-chain fatty acid--CoA ligase [Myxococcales bacterium]
MSHDTIPARLQEQGRVRAEQGAYHIKRDGQWHGTSWGTYAKEVHDAARALIGLGLEPGGTVGVLGFNRPEWSIFSMGAMSAGGAPAGIYTTCSAPEVAYVISHAGAAVVLLEDEGQWGKVQAELDNLPLLKHVVMMKGAPTLTDDSGRVTIHSWEDFMATASAVPAEVVGERIDALQPDQLATLIYTSGTTGPPKGVMLSHQNLAWTAQIAGVMVEIDDRDSSLSYLPLSHIAEQLFTLHGPATYGHQIYYAESLDKVADNLKEVRPTIVFAVPRIWEKFYAGIRAKLKEAPPLKRTLAAWAMGVGEQIVDLENRGESIPGVLQLQNRLADKLVLSKVRAALGLGNLRFAVSGAAPISPEILTFLGGIGVPVREVYGQSEDSGPTSFNRPGRTRFGSVGPAVPGVDVRIADDGEICVKGPNVYLGYYKNEAATADALKDGWLHSGDLGKIDDEGFLHITGRKKDIIITAGGKNIAPKNIEASLKNDDLITEAVVIGDRRKFISALICLDPDVAAKFAQDNGLDAATVHEAPALIAAVQEVVDATNVLFARVEHVRKFTVLPRPLSVEAGELTPTLKVKRKVVNEAYADTIDAMYPKD